MNEYMAGMDEQMTKGRFVFIDSVRKNPFAIEAYRYFCCVMSSSLPKLTNDRVQAFLNKAEIVQETAEQIMKDFGIFGLQITFSGNTEQAYLELHKQVSDQIESLIKNSYSTLISVLYRIDLSEEELKKGTKELPNYNPVEAMAHLIIVRELKKVLSRKYYS
jgi:hypothetical protein